MRLVNGCLCLVHSYGRLRASLGRLEAVLASPLSGLTYEALGTGILPVSVYRKS
jgi:hypothetical protein